MKDLVSIITPSYNSSKFLAECIDSVISQTYLNWELLIVDDASEDVSQSIINDFSLKDNRIKPIFLKNNVGPAQARNLALNKAKGRFVAFLDSDDIWKKDKLTVQLKFMLENNIHFSFSSYETISEDGLSLCKEISAPLKVSYNDYLKNTIIGCLTVVVDKQYYRTLKMPIIRSSHDMALWLILLRNGNLAYGINKPLAKYRIVSSSNTNNKLKSAYDVWLVYRNHERLSFIFSLYNFSFYVFNAIKKRI